MRFRTLQKSTLIPIILVLAHLGNPLWAFEEKASFEVEAERQSYRPGEVVQLKGIMDIDEGWHTNSNTPTFDYLIATEIKTELPEEWPPATISYPKATLASFTFAEKELSVFEGREVIGIRLEIPADAVGAFEIPINLRYQACNDNSCLPPITTKNSVSFEVSGAAVEAVKAQKSPDTSIWGVFLLAFIGGLILNAMPCVLPVLSLKIFGLVKASGKGHRAVTTGALATTAGILASFWALAGAVIIAKSAGEAVGWGMQFQSPIFVTFLTILVLFFCLNLWGIFEIPLPGRLADIAGSGPREGLAGHFVSGLFATLMATPCSAPFLGSAVSFALVQNAVIILGVFTAIALGMALPYLVLAVRPKTASLLPKPGAWMEHLRGLMAFLLAAAALWLLYVLSSQMTAESLLFVELALLGLIALIWVNAKILTSGGAKKIATVLIILASLGTLYLAGQSQRSSSVKSEEESTQYHQWVTFDFAEAERLVAAGETVFIDVTADWCITCKVNENLILETAEIGAAFEAHQVITMKADWTNYDEGIAEFMASYGRHAIPFYLLLRPGQEPHLFSEVLTKGAITSALENAS